MRSCKSLKLIVMWYLIGMCWVSVVIFLSTTSDPPDTSNIAFGDKIFHALAYFCLFFWFGQIYKENKLWIPASALVIMGISLEFVQYNLGYRTLEIADMLANTTGVLTGWLVSYYLCSGLFEFIEKWIFSRSRA